MAIVNKCFKRVFIFFNILLLLVGIFLLGFGKLGNSLHHPLEGQNIFAVLCFYVIGGASLAFSVFGIYGAQREKKWALIVFFTGMVLGNLGLLLISATASWQIPMAIQSIEGTFYESVPLDEASPDVKKMLTAMQSELKCCGSFNGYQDWRGHIPFSCLCQQPFRKCERVNGSLALGGTAAPDAPTFEREMVVFQEPCVPLLTNALHLVLNTVLGLCIALSIIMFIGMGMSMTMICRLRRGCSQVTVDRNPDTPYTELHNAVEA